MAVSDATRQALKRRTRRARRGQVALFFFWMMLGLLEAGRPLSWHTFVGRVFPYLWVLVWANSGRNQRILPVSSLDDRAMVEHGVEFERLGEVEQKDLLKRYRVGRYLRNYFPDEREEELEQESKERAYGVLRWLLPGIAVVYWAGWRFLPVGSVRAHWTDGPVVMAWALLLVLVMPQVVRMWTEPDEVGDPKIVAMEREA